MTLSNFRFSFLNAQNKADFFKAGKSLVSEFRKLQMEEKMENQNDIDQMTLRISKKRIVFFWNLNNESRILVLNKEESNFTRKANYFEGFVKAFHDCKMTDKISIYDTEIISTLVKRIGDLFTGENWHEIYEEAV